MKNKKILIMGLPGSGKTTLAKKIVSILKAEWLNADKVRGKYKDWDFSKEGIIRQVNRMSALASKSRNKHVVADFVCPIKKQMDIFKPDFVIWMNTIHKSRYPTMNKIFKNPKKFDLEITSKDANFWIPLIFDKMTKKKIINERFLKSTNDNFNSAIILCGGRGTRLGNLGKQIPKTLVKIHGKPILWYILKSLLKNSINHFILPLGYRGNQIKKYIKSEPEFKKLKIDLIETGLDTNISKRIFLVKNKIKSKSLVLLNGDAIFDFNLKKILKNHLSKKKDITFLGCSAPLSYGIVGIKSGKIKSFERDIEFNFVKTYKRKNFSGHIFSGISVIKSDLILNNFKQTLNFEREFYPRILKRNNSIFEDIKGFWYSVDNEKDIKNLNSKFQNLNYIKIKKIKKYLINK